MELMLIFCISVQHRANYCLMHSHSTFIEKNNTNPSFPCYLIVIDEFLQFISMDNNMQATHLSKAELFPIYTCETHLRENAIISNHESNIGDLMHNFHCIFSVTNTKAKPCDMQYLLKNVILLVY